MNTIEIFVNTWYVEKNRHYKRDGDSKNESFGCTCSHVHSSIYSGHLVNVKEVDGLSQDINSK